MGNRGPKPTSPKELKLFARLYYENLYALAYGRIVRRFDRDYFDQRVSAANIPKLSFGAKDEIEKSVEQSIADGVVAESERKTVIEDLKNIALLRKEREISEPFNYEADRWIEEPGMPETLHALVNARKTSQIRKICESARKTITAEVRAGVYKDLVVEAWPIEAGSVFPDYLSKHAKQFIAARQEPRFPGADRPSSAKKRLWFFACALAGGVLGLKTRTAVNLLVRVKPPKIRRKKPPSQRDLEAQALAQIDIIKSYF